MTINVKKQHLHTIPTEKKGFSLENRVENRLNKKGEMSDMWYLYKKKRLKRVK